MKKHYNDPRFEVLAEDLADILTTSVLPGDGDVDAGGDNEVSGGDVL